MHIFFHGWRRKVGCVTLVMSLAVMGLWMRSRIVCDLFGIPIGERQTVLWSLDGKAYWFGCNADGGDWFGLTSRQLNQKVLDGVNRQRAELAQQPAMEYKEWSVPYLPVAIGLTLLSAYLILWKPRKQVQAVSGS